MSYYQPVDDSDLAPVRRAKSSTIRHMEVHIEEAIRDSVNDIMDNSSVIIGSDEYAFHLSPAPKLGGNYIDNYNPVDSNSEVWMSFKDIGFRQKFRKNKTSSHTFLVRLRNLYHKPQEVFFELRNTEDNALIKESIVTIPENTYDGEFKVFFGADHLPTSTGIDSSLNKHYDYTEGKEVETPDATVGGVPGEFYFVIRPLFKNTSDLTINGDEDIGIMDDTTFCILGDIEAKYGAKLESSGDGGVTYGATSRDLYFYDIYAGGNTYLCDGGKAIINGQHVISLDTHVSITGASSFGDVLSLVYMNEDGHLGVINSDAFTNEDNVRWEYGSEELNFILPIAYITTYMNDRKYPLIFQDDESNIVRKRSYNERLRRQEGKTSYLTDRALPSRLKLIFEGSELIRDPLTTDIIKCDSNEGVSEGGKWTIATDSDGNIIYKSLKGEIVSVSVNLKGTTNSYIDTQPAQKVSENSNIEIDATKGIAKLKTNVEKGTGTGMDAKNSKSKDIQLWEKKKDSKGKEHSYKYVKTSLSKQSSTLPGITYYSKANTKLKKITIPVTRFKDISKFRFRIYNRTSTNIKTGNPKKAVNDGIKLVFTSKYYDVTKNAKVKDKKQVLSKAPTFDADVTLKGGEQYVFIIDAIPKNSKTPGYVYVRLYDRADKNYSIKYQGNYNATRFDYKNADTTVWDNTTAEVEEVKVYEKTGTITSGTATFSTTEKIKSISYDGNITTPEGTSHKVEVNCGGEWVELTQGKANSDAKINKSNNFKWRVTLNGTKDKTPEITYLDDKKYALNFTLVREEANIDPILDDSLNCFTTKTIRPNELLAEYIGDDSFKAADRFSNYEFLSLFCDENDGDLTVDIHASAEERDADGNLTNKAKCPGGKTPATGTPEDIFSLIYSDLKLSDFSKQSIDYTPYDPKIEEDEYNLRLKLEQDAALIDNNILIADLDDFEVLPFDKEQKNFTIGEESVLTSTNAFSDPQTLYRKKYENQSYLDLSQYNSITVNYNSNIDGIIDSEVEDRASNSVLGFYVSRAYEQETPHIMYDNENASFTVMSADTLGKYQVQDNGLPDLNKNAKDLITEYFNTNKVLRWVDESNGIYYIGYYKAIVDPNDSSRYVWEQIHDLNSYELYMLDDIIKAGENNFKIVIDSKNETFKSIKEMGIVALPQENGSTISGFGLKNIKTSQTGYQKIYDGGNTEMGDWEPMELNEGKTFKLINYTGKEIKSKRVWMTQDTIKEKTGSTKIAILKNTCDLEKFKHFGIQLASNLWIPKGFLSFDFCSDLVGNNVVHSMIVPTLNNVIYGDGTGVGSGFEAGNGAEIPSTAGTAKINFTQIYKKISDKNKIKSIVLVMHGENSLIDKVLTTDKNFNLLIKNVTLYDQDTIPIFHTNVRMKIYANIGNNDYSVPTIRKMRAVAIYK